MSDEIVISGSVDIVACDHGGEGSPVLLVHGAGGHLLQWRDFPGRLRQRHRVVSLDLRCHGKSGDGPWTLANLIDDLESVCHHFGLRAPAVVGHSLGGIVAAAWMSRHPESLGVSIDGHRSAVTHPENYDGLPADQLREQLRTLTALFDAQTSAMKSAVPDQQLDAMRRHHIELDSADPESVAAARFQRGLSIRDGQTFVRPDAATAQRLRTMDEFVDAVDVIKQLTGRFLLLVATRDMPMVPPEFADLMAAHRRGLRRDLSDVPDNVAVREIDASHDAIREAGAEVAQHVLRFLADDARNAV